MLCASRPRCQTLKLTRRAGPDGAATFRAYPWSPRWPVEEMAARIFNFLRDEAARAAPKLSGVAAAAAAAAGPAAAAQQQPSAAAGSAAAVTGFGAT